MITPMEIHNREFKKGFRGYSEAEVDEFLDRIVVDYEKVLRENEKLRDQLALNAQEVENYKKLEKNLQDTLSVAQKTADEVLDSAKKSAQELRDNAVRDTQSIYNNTMRETQNIREQAQLESKRLLDDAAHKLRIIVTEYEKIVREKNSFLMKIRTALESELAVTAQLLTSVPHIDELSTLKASLTKIESENKIAAQVVEEKISEPETIEKVSQVVSKPKTKSAEVEKKSASQVEKISPSEKSSRPEVTSAPEKISAPEKKSEVAEKKVSDLENTKLVEKVEKILPAEKKSAPEPIVDDLDKTMTYTPIKKPAE